MTRAAAPCSNTHVANPVPSRVPLPLAVAVVPALVAMLLATHMASALQEEKAVMHKLRRALHAVDPRWIEGFGGWQAGSPGHHCTWHRVVCDRSGHVNRIELNVENRAERAAWNAAEGAAPINEGGRDAPTNPLLPELAQLEKLEALVLTFESPVHGAIPAEWGAPGAFPCLSWLQLTGPSLEGPLPDFHPGALPRLTSLRIKFDQLPSALPASWGASPDVLPALQELSLELQLSAPLPPQWDRGFCQLHRLQVSGSRQPGSLQVNDDRRWGYVDLVDLADPADLVDLVDPADLADLAGEPNRGGQGASSRRAPVQHAPVNLGWGLPAEWAAGFPNLFQLALTRLGLTGSIPEAWAKGGFPNMTHLELSYNFLSGSLPAQLLQRHPSLQYVHIISNDLTGTLPAAWSRPSGVKLLDFGHNQLIGPALPPSWLEAGSMPLLARLVLTGNAGLGGTLPANLSWPFLEQLFLEDTQMNGSIPASWCQAPFAMRFKALKVAGTDISPMLPSCFNKSMLELSGVLSDERQSPTTAVLWLLLLPAAGIAAWALRRGRLPWQRRALQHQSQDAQRLLSAMPVQPQCGLSDVELGVNPDSARSCMDSTFAPSSIAAELQGRRARLAGLLSSLAGPRAECLPMLVLRPLPGHLAHNVSSSASPSYSLKSASDRVTTSSVSEGSLAAGPAPHATTAGSLRGTGETSEASTSMAISTLAFGRVSSRSQVLNRQWGLDTRSLLLDDGELQMVTGNDGKLVMLGEGSHGVVYQALLSGQLVAVKVFELTEKVDAAKIWREVALLKQCTHPRIVAIYGVAVNAHLILVAMEDMKGGSLRAALQHDDNRRQLLWAARGRQVAIDIIEALEFLHSLGILHCDLKSSNVLLSQDYRACISDLGISQVLGSRARTAAGGSDFSAAPEQLMGQRCTLAADMYSFGILLIELITQPTELVRGMLRLPEAPQECSQAVADLVRACIGADPSKRPTAAQALQLLQADAG